MSGVTAGGASARRVIGLLLGAALHGVALIALLRERHVALAVDLHFAGSALWGFSAARWLPVAQRSAWWLLAGCALVFPVAGLLASLALIAVLRRPAVDHSDRRYVVWKEQPRGEWSDSLPAGDAGQSIVEILQSPRTQLRRNAVLALRELDPQMAIPLLRKGLQDSDEQVRIYAQNILSTMLERFESSLKELEQQLRAQPSAALPARRLAEQFFELVYLDVAGDDETAAHYLGKALALLDRAAAAEPADAEIALLGLKYALRARNAATAHRWQARLDQLGYDPQHVLPWTMELAFLEADWTKLQELFRTFAAAGYFNPRIDEVARFWSGQAVNAS